MDKPKRIVDINGQMINAPEHYHETLKWGNHMIDKMDEDNVDRSDMPVVINDLYRELTFNLTFLKRRDKRGS